MKTSKEVLNMVQIFYHHISYERLSVEALYQDAFGLDLHLDYDIENHVNTYSDPKNGELGLINRLERLDKKLKQAQERVDHYIFLVDWIEKLCIVNLDETELLVIRLSYFGKEKQNRFQVARQLNYSEPWVTKVRTSAYQKLDQALIDLQRKHQLPEEFDDAHL